MELLLALGAFVLVDVLAIHYAVDSRPLALVRKDESLVPQGRIGRVRRHD